MHILACSVMVAHHSAPVAKSRMDSDGVKHRDVLPYLGTRFWQLRAARAARGAPAGGSAGVAGAHKFTEGDYFLFPFRRVSRLRRPFVLWPATSPCRTGRPAAICARRIAGVKPRLSAPRGQRWKRDEGAGRAPWGHQVLCWLQRRPCPREPAPHHPEPPILLNFSDSLFPHQRMAVMRDAPARQNCSEPPTRRPCPPTQRDRPCSACSTPRPPPRCRALRAVWICSQPDVRRRRRPSAAAISF